MTPRRPSADEIAARLADQAGAVCDRLAADGYLDGGREAGGRRWRCRSTDAGGQWGDSLSVELAGDRAGWWNHGAACTGGKSLISLVRYLVGGSEWAPAFAWCNRYLGLGDDGAGDLPPPQPRPAPAPSDRDERNRAFAREIWQSTRPAPGTLAETYWRARGIRAPVPPSVRFHPGLRHPTLSRNELVPALVAGVQLVDGSFAGVWRIYLAGDGQGKAPGIEAKLGLGPVRGGAVRLGPPADKLILCEGLETGGSLLDLGWSASVWVCLSTSGLLGVELPGQVAEVVIAQDFDPRDMRLELVGKRPDGTEWRRPNPNYGKRPGVTAGRRAAERFRAEGRRVVELLPHTEGMDFNDVMQGAR
jgi:hypothetical protein